MHGLMQSTRLTLDVMIDHAARWHGEREIVSRAPDGSLMRTTYALCRQRARRLSAALRGFGAATGDRIATLAWNSARHLEAWYAIMGMGCVCHTLNPRLFPEQIAWIINHAEDRMIIADAAFAPLLDRILPGCPTVERVILISDADTPPEPGSTRPLDFETLVLNHDPDGPWGGFDENTAAGLCYTSGTTGDPKGVLYSHRSNYLHTLVSLQPDVFALSALDVVMPLVPMFHANAWGLAFSAPAVGAGLVMPGSRLDGASVHELMEMEGVTFSAGVPTVWQALTGYLAASGKTLSTLKRAVIGGSAVSLDTVMTLKAHGVDVIHCWGMTEMSPMGAVSTPTRQVACMTPEERLAFTLKQGRPPLGIDLKLADDAGARLARDGVEVGRLLVRGATVAGGYFKGAAGDILDAEGYFDTGDVATIDTHGFMQITDRAKDVIKSGGEWISSIDIENIAMGHPKAALAAVIGVAHPKWDERPLLLIQLKPGARASSGQFLAFLEGKIAKWWMPDEVVFVEEIPLGATGKIDKKLIRQRMARAPGQAGV